MKNLFGKVLLLPFKVLAWPIKALFGALKGKLIIILAIILLILAIVYLLKRQIKKKDMKNMGDAIAKGIAKGQKNNLEWK